MSRQITHNMKRAKGRHQTVPAGARAAAPGLNAQLSIRCANKLAVFNRRWQQRLSNARRRICPWWTPGVVVTDEMRRQYELYLPVDRFAQELRMLARCALPHAAWVPAALRVGSSRHEGNPGIPATPRSVPDLWDMLPLEFAGRVVFSAPDLLPLLCAVADPPTFGTRRGRYPEQLAWVRQWAAGNQGRMLRVLDIGCGTGAGTREIAAQLAQGTVVGVTREPLETWLATRHCYPHRHAAAAGDNRPPPDVNLEFCSGNATALPLNVTFDLVVANGLVGGPCFQTRRQFSHFLRELKRLTGPESRVVLANRFHAGHACRIAAFADQARSEKWRVTGSLQFLKLCPA